MGFPVLGGNALLPLSFAEMTHLAANLKALRAAQPIAGAVIAAADSWLGHTESAPDGERTVRSGGASGNWVHSRRAPLQEARRLIGSISPKPLQTVVLNGAGTGLVARLALESFQGRKVLVIEPDLRLLRLALELHDFSDAITAGRLVLGVDLPGDPLSTLLSTRVGDLSIYGFSQLEHSYAAQDGRCAPLLATFQQWVKTMQVAWQTQFVGLRYAHDNALANLPRYLRSVGLAPFRGVLKGQPAVLVAAGPSLARNVDVLREWSGKVYTHVVSSALKRVLDAGVHVHSTHVIDYHHLSVRYFEGLESPPPLFAQPGCHPGVLEAHRGQIILGDSPLYRTVFAEQVPDRLDLSGETSNVAHHGFRLLQMMGASPIILVGLDQANSFHITHAPGTAFFDDLAASAHRFCSLEMNELLWVTSKNERVGEDVYGNPLTADVQMAESAARFEALFRADPSRPVINATEGGRRLSGTTDITLRKALESCVRKPLDSARVKAAFDAAANVPSRDRPRAKKALERSIKYAEELGASARATVLALGAAHHDARTTEQITTAARAVEQFNSAMASWRQGSALIQSLTPADTFRRRKARQEALDESLAPEQRARMELAIEHDYAGAVSAACQRWSDDARRALARIDEVAVAERPRESEPASSSPLAKRAESESAAGVTRSGQRVSVDAFIQWSGDPAVDAAFVGDSTYSPLKMALLALDASPAIGRILLPWSEAKGPLPVESAKLTVLPNNFTKPYAREADVKSLFGWNHCGTLRGLSMSTTLGAEGDPMMFLYAQEAAGVPSTHCVVVTSQTGFLTSEVIESLIERGRSTSWEQAFYVAEGPRGLVPFLFERESMLTVLRQGELAHAAFLQMANFWGASYAHMPPHALHSRRSYHLADGRSRDFSRQIAATLDSANSAPPTLRAITDSAERLQGEWVGALPRDLELEVTTDRDINPAWLPPIARRATMTAEQAKHIIVQLEPCRDSINLTLGGHGDPLLHPDLYGILEYARPRVARINLRTFGAQLSPDTAARLRALGVDVLTVRLGVWDRAAYAEDTGVDRFDALVETMKQILAQGVATGRQVMMLVPEVLKSLRGDRTLLDFRDAWYTPFSWPHVIDYSTWGGTVPPKQAIGLYPRTRKPCLRLEEQMIVYADGTVPLCTQDYDGEAPIGNANATPLSELWRSERFEAARAAHRAKLYHEAKPECANCDQWFRLT